MLECVNECSLAIEGGDVVDCVFLDLRKAFDSVVHSKLLAKCWAYGLRGKLYNYIRAFLSNRWQRVKINNSFSSWKMEKSC